MSDKDTSKDLLIKTNEPKPPVKPKRDFKGFLVGFCIGIFLAVITRYFVFIPIAAIAGRSKAKLWCYNYNFSS